MLMEPNAAAFRDVIVMAKHKTAPFIDAGRGRAGKIGFERARRTGLQDRGNIPPQKALQGICSHAERIFGR